jgi:hypothetical protein
MLEAAAALLGRSSFRGFGAASSKLVEVFDAHGVTFVSVTRASTPPPAWAG